jgi:hypothetical protein
MSDFVDTSGEAKLPGRSWGLLDHRELLNPIWVYRSRDLHALDVTSSTGWPATSAPFLRVLQAPVGRTIAPPATWSLTRDCRSALFVSLTAARLGSSVPF